MKQWKILHWTQNPAVATPSRFNSELRHHNITRINTCSQRFSFSEYLSLRDLSSILKYVQKPDTWTGHLNPMSVVLFFNMKRMLERLRG